MVKKMVVLNQSSKPQITFYNYKTGTCYQTFSINSTNISGKNLQSYSFERSVKQLTGSFQIQIKEDTTAVTGMFLDKVNHMDIVKISEDGINVDFIGFVTTISFGATAANNNKVINISGKSIEGLFDLFMISGDVTAQSFFNAQVSQLDLLTELNKNGKDPTSVVDAVQTVFNCFTEVAGKYKGISSTQILTMINKYYGNVSSWLDAGSLKFQFGITSNLFNNGTMKIFPFIRNLLPEDVYEIYGYIENGKPKIRIREVPFTNTSFAKLKQTTVSPSIITDYTLTKSNEEVYTVFLSYIEGSPMDADFYKKINSTTSGYSNAEDNQEMISLYGYRPKYVNFIGYNRADNDTDQAAQDDTITNKIKALNEKVADWYSKLPEMYSGDISVVNYHDKTMPKIGERINLCKGSFYVTKEKHSFRYGSSPTINYTIERGGAYTGAGTFVPLKGISTPFAELLNK